MSDVADKQIKRQL